MNVVVGEHAGKARRSGHQVLLEIKDRRVVDILARLAEETDPERRPRLNQSSGVGHHQPVGFPGVRPGPATKAPVDSGSERRSDSSNRGEIIQRSSGIRELAPKNRLARRQTDTYAHGDRTRASPPPGVRLATIAPDEIRFGLAERRSG